MDYSKIQEQIEAVKAAQIKAELDLMAAANARLEAARVENERRRAEAEKAYLDASEAKRLARLQAEENHKAVERAEQARKHAEEHKINLAMEAKARDEQNAAELKQKLRDLEFQNEQALKALRDSYDMAANSELTHFAVTDEQVVPDGTAPKPVVDNVDGATHPLKHHLFAVNK